MGHGPQPMTLELKHGRRREKLELPLEKLDKDKKYLVTFSMNQNGSGRMERKYVFQNSNWLKISDLGSEGHKALGLRVIVLSPTLTYSPEEV